MARILAKTQMKTTAKNPRTESPGKSSTYFGKTGAQNVAADLPHYKPDQSQAHGLLHDHRGDGSIFCADEFEPAISRIFPIVRV